MCADVLRWRIERWKLPNKRSFSISIIHHFLFQIFSLFFSLPSKCFPSHPLRVSPLASSNFSHMFSLLPVSAIVLASLCVLKHSPLRFLFSLSNNVSHPCSSFSDCLAKFNSHFSSIQAVLCSSKPRTRRTRTAWSFSLANKSWKVARWISHPWRLRSARRSHGEWIIRPLNFSSPLFPAFSVGIDSLSGFPTKYQWTDDVTMMRLDDKAGCCLSEGQ